MNILFIAPFKNFSAKDGGYGNASLSYVTVLNSLKKKGHIDSIDYINTLDLYNAGIDYNKKYDFAFIIAHPQTFNNPLNVNKFKDILQNCKERYLHVLWETMPLPMSWKFLFDDKTLFTGFFASSYFILNQLQYKTGLPIYYIPYLVEIPDKGIDIKQKENSEKIFTVLLMGQDTPRKGLEDGVIAFNRAFNNMSNIQLIIKYHTLDNTPSVEFENKVIHLSQSNSNCVNSNIFIINEELSKEDVYTLYKNSSVLLTPSRGEGFCLPLTEAMSVGLPCIYTDWSAMSEVAKSSCNKPIDYVLDESISMYNYGYEIGSVYAYPSILSTMKALRVLHNKWAKNKKQYYTDGNKNISVINNLYNKDVVEGCFMNLLNKTNIVAPKWVFNNDHMTRNREQYQEILKRYKEIIND